MTNQTLLLSHNCDIEKSYIEETSNQDQQINKRTLEKGTNIDTPYLVDVKAQKISDYTDDHWQCKTPFLVNKIVKPDEIFFLKSWLTVLKSIPEETDFLIIKTGFESYRNKTNRSDEDKYLFQNPGIAPDFGVWLRQNLSLKMLGFDFFSVSNFKKSNLGQKSNQALLCKQPPGFTEPLKSGPILIINDMKLSGIHSTPQKVTITPLNKNRNTTCPTDIIAEF